MQFSDLQTEFFERGFEDLNDAGVGLARAKRWLNQAYLEICDYDHWPFLEATQTGTAPLTISDLRTIIYVTDTTNDLALPGEDWRTVRDIDPDLTQTGNPELWYLEGTTTLKVWPPNTDASLSVRYLKVPAELSAGTDIPIFAARWHDLIVDGAVVRGYKNKDNFDAASAVRNEWERGMAQMTFALASRNLMNPYDIAPAGGSVDW